MGNIDSGCCTVRDRDVELTPEELGTPRCSARETPKCSARETPRCSARDRLKAYSKRDSNINSARGPAALPSAICDDIYIDTEVSHGPQGPALNSVADRIVLRDRTNELAAEAVTEKELPAKAVFEKHPSMGSALHAAGECKRCCFFPRNRCSNGYNCEFCHYDHEKRARRKRNRKGGQNQPAIDTDDLDDCSEDATRDTGLEIQLPPTPESLAGDTAFGSWSNTPEGAAVFVQSCLGTFPADTQQNTTAVPVYTRTLWDDNRTAAQRQCWATDGGDCPAWGAVHDNVRSAENRLLPAHGFTLPETAPLTLHQWQDAAVGQWQQQDSAWPELAEWGCYETPEELPWAWNTQVETRHAASWNECSLGENLTTAMDWNAQSAMSSAYPDASQMPEYMPAIQCIPLRPTVAEHTDGLSVSTGLATYPLRYPPGVLPPGVEVLIDVETPPLSPEKLEK